MKSSNLYKSLIDVLFYFQFALLIIILLLVLFGNTEILIQNEPSDHVWIQLIGYFISYIYCLLGLYYLRKTAKSYTNNLVFTNENVNNLKKAGNNLLYSGAIALTTYFIKWLFDLYNGYFGIEFNESLFITLFLCAIGAFLILQSNSINKAKDYKEENELTI